MISPRYFMIGERPVRVDTDGEVRAMDPDTGAMLPVVELSKDEYRQRLDALRQPLLERLTAAALRWEQNADHDLPYRVVFEGHELVIRAGDFPDEALYLLRIDGHETYEIDDWPAAWIKPSPAVQNLCDDYGWLVDGRELPTDPVDHDAEALPKLGCTDLRCLRCRAKVRTAHMSPSPTGVVDVAALYETPDLAASPQLVPSQSLRVYLCRCEFHVESHARRLDDEEQQIWTPWMCAGHPFAALPHVFDGVLVTAENLEPLVADSLAGTVPAGARATDRNDGVWGARLCIRLSNTPHARLVVSAVAARLTHPDLKTRVRALYFFANVPSRASAMRADVLLGRHAELFVGVEDPNANSRTPKTLEHLIWRTAGAQLPSNTALRELARAFALDPKRSSETLFIALAHHDAQWFAASAAKLAAANPLRTQELRSASALLRRPAAGAR